MANLIDCRDMIVKNLKILKHLVITSNDPAKVFKIRAYDNALRNLPMKCICTKHDLIMKNGKPFAGKSLLYKTEYIIGTKKNLPLVDDFLKDDNTANMEPFWETMEDKKRQLKEENNPMVESIIESMKEELYVSNRYENVELPMFKDLMKLNLA